MTPTAERVRASTAANFIVIVVWKMDDFGISPGIRYIWTSGGIDTRSLASRPAI